MNRPINQSNFGSLRVFDLSQEVSMKFQFQHVAQSMTVSSVYFNLHPQNVFILVYSASQLLFSYLKSSKFLNIVDPFQVFAYNSASVNDIKPNSHRSCLRDHFGSNGMQLKELSSIIRREPNGFNFIFDLNCHIWANVDTRNTGYWPSMSILS